VAYRDVPFLHRCEADPNKKMLPSGKVTSLKIYMAMFRSSSREAFSTPTILIQFPFLQL
jgi:hypothetical protein